MSGIKLNTISHDWLIFHQTWYKIVHPYLLRFSVGHMSHMTCTIVWIVFKMFRCVITEPDQSLLCRSWTTAVRGRCAFPWWPRASPTGPTPTTWWGRTARTDTTRRNSDPSAGSLRKYHQLSLSFSVAWSFPCLPFQGEKLSLAWSEHIIYLDETSKTSAKGFT